MRDNSRSALCHSLVTGPNGGHPPRVTVLQAPALSVGALFLSVPARPNRYARPSLHRPLKYRENWELTHLTLNFVEAPHKSLHFPTLTSGLHRVRNDTLPSSLTLSEPHHPMRFPVTLIFLLLAYWTLTALQMDHVADDPGLGWHILTGESILKSHTVPRIDPFLASTSPRPWIADQWLSDALFAGVLQLGGTEHGMPLLYAVLTAIFLLTFMGITYASAARHAGSPILGGLAAFLALKLGSIHFIVRPVVLGFLLFSIVTFLLWEIVRTVRRGDQVTLRKMGILIPLAVLWANLHPSFGVGIIVLTLMTVGLLYDTVIVEQRPLDTPLFIVLVSSVALMGLSTLINPYGSELLRQVFTLVSDDFFMNLNSEWRAINPRNGEGQLFFTIVTILGLGAFVSPRRTRPLYFTELLVVGFLAFSTLKSVRFLPYFAIVSAPLVAHAIRNLLHFEPLGRLKPYRRLGALLGALDRREHQAQRTYGCILALLISLSCISAYRLGAIYLYRGPFGPSHDLFPYDGAEALRTVIHEKKIPTPVAIAATPDWGGFLARAGGGDFKPVIDDRNSLLGVAPYKDYLASTTIGGDLTGYLHRVGASFLLLKANEPLAVYLRDTGRLPELWRGEVSALFELPVG